MSMVVTQSKLVGETVSVQFDFTSLLAPGETISGDAVTASVFAGLDNTPSAILSGSPTVSGATISQKITAGTAGVVYLLNASATTSAGQVLILQTYLAVTDTNPFQ